jgi:hypothetical protein
MNPIGCEDPEELAQDAIAIAAGLVVSAENRGKKVSPGNIAYYAVGLIRQGRRSTGLVRAKQLELPPTVSLELLALLNKTQLSQGGICL